MFFVISADEEREKLSERFVYEYKRQSGKK